MDILPNKFGEFLVLLAGGIMITACKKEFVQKDKSLCSNFQKSNIETNSNIIMQMWVYNLQDCVPLEDHCLPPIVVRPSNLSYLKLKNAITNGSEHNFFNYTIEAKQLFSFLYKDAMGQMLLHYLLDKGNKLLVVFNKELKKEYYLCVDDNLKPEDYKEGMKKLTLQISIDE